MGYSNDMTVQEVLRRASSLLENRFSKEESRILAERLLTHLQQWSRSQLLLNYRQLISIDWTVLNAMIQKLLDGYPIQYLMGYEEFYGYRFEVTQDTLIPRPETEELVDRVLKVLPTYPNPTVLEIGVGTGCVLESLALEYPSAHYSGSDLSKEALAVAKKNAETHQLGAKINWYQSDVWQMLPNQKWDIVMSNPPYISLDEKVVMDQQVIDYEPHLALFAGENGLAIYRRIAQGLAEHLSAGGQAFFEIGYCQGQSVKKIMEEAVPQGQVCIHQDMSGHNRIVQVSMRGKETVK